MATKKKTTKKKSRVGKKVVKRKATKKKLGTAKLAAGEPMGACRWQDKSGQWQCQSPVTKAFCDSKGGDFTEDDRCP
jgi:hypothetical protein